MREICTSGSEGGASQTNETFLPLSTPVDAPNFTRRYQDCQSVSTAPGIRESQGISNHLVRNFTVRYHSAELHWPRFGVDYLLGKNCRCSNGQNRVLGVAIDPACRVTQGSRCSVKKNRDWNSNRDGISPQTSRQNLCWHGKAAVAWFTLYVRSGG